MKTLLLPIMTLAMVMLPAAANAAQCRNTDTGKFAKCGAPGSVPASQYVAKTKTAAKSRSAAKPKMMASTMATPAATPTKSGFMGMMQPKPKPTTGAMAASMGKPAPMMKPMAKTARCKNAKSKFVKCGTPGALPV